jgi:hypothetical protein
MQLNDLREEIDIELSLMENTVHELVALQRDLVERQPTIREKTAASAFLAQFYGGMENILKRICRFHNIPLPQGDTWHLDLFNMFCDPLTPPLPLLFDKGLKAELIPFRKFRHLVHHGYGIQLEWERMLPGIESVEEIFQKLKAIIIVYVDRLSGTNGAKPNCSWI